jgi:hypothetical protein
VTGWDDAVDAALVGTARSPFGGGLPPPLDGLTVDGLLTTAAVLSRARRAGMRLAPVGRPLPEPAGQDDRPVVGRTGEALLREALAGPQEVLVEGLGLVASAGRLLAPLLLPDVLDAGRRDVELRAALLPVLGARAAWLARLRPEWAWATGAGVESALDEQDWQTATLGERLAALVELRRTDPDRGRVLVESTWAVDPPAERAAHVLSLGEGLSIADEPLLERALDDRRAEVRRAAVDLLARLPDSAHARRAEARAAQVLRVERKLVRRGVVVVPPEDDDPELLRDTARATAPPHEGAAAWRLERTVAVAPLRLWTELSGLTPGQLLAAVDRTDWAKPFRLGLRTAVLRDPDPEWVIALLGDQLDRELLQALPAAGREAVVGRLLDSGHAVGALLALPGPWSAELSRRTGGLVDRLARRGDAGRYESAELLRVAGYRLHHTTRLELSPGEVHSDLQPSYAVAVTALSTRAALRRAILEESP